MLPFLSNFLISYFASISYSVVKTTICFKFLVSLSYIIGSWLCFWSSSFSSSLTSSWFLFDPSLFIESNIFSLSCSLFSSFLTYSTELSFLSTPSKFSNFLLSNTNFIFGNWQPTLYKIWLIVSKSELWLEKIISFSVKEHLSNYCLNFYNKTVLYYYFYSMSSHDTISTTRLDSFLNSLASAWSSGSVLYENLASSLDWMIIKFQGRHVKAFRIINEESRLWLDTPGASQR